MSSLSDFVPSAVLEAKLDSLALSSEVWNFQITFLIRASWQHPSKGKIASQRFSIPPKKTRRGPMIKSSQKKVATLPQMRTHPKRPQRGQP
jgi:hypothetical protein